MEGGAAPIAAAAARILSLGLPAPNGDGDVAAVRASRAGAVVAASFFAGALRAATFVAGALFAGALRAATFFGGALPAAVFLAGAFFAAVFFAAALARLRGCDASPRAGVVGGIGILLAVGAADRQA